jgi:acyl dehydratase
VPIDPDALGAATPAATRSWTEDDSMLYALAIGAGGGELSFTTENTAGVDQQAYPTQAVVVGPVDTAVLGLLGEFDRRMTVHGTQRIDLHRPVAVAGNARSVTEVTAIHDKGKAAVIELTTRTLDAATDEALFTTVTGLYVRGAGGFGAARGELTPRRPVPERGPDVQLRAPTGVDQALLYRLTGDRNPLHSDPGFAAAVGFDRPILHGLCTYGIAGRVLLHALCDGRAERVRSIEGRFSAPVLPGDVLTVHAWAAGEGEAAFAVLGPDGRAVLSDGRLTWR